MVGLLIIPAQEDQKVLRLDHQTGGVDFRHCYKSRKRMSVVSDW